MWLIGFDDSSLVIDRLCAGRYWRLLRFCCGMSSHRVYARLLTRDTSTSKRENTITENHKNIGYFFKIELDLSAFIGTQVLFFFFLKSLRDISDRENAVCVEKRFHPLATGSRLTMGSWMDIMHLRKY